MNAIEFTQYANELYREATARFSDQMVVNTALAGMDFISRQPEFADRPVHFEQQVVLNINNLRALMSPTHDEFLHNKLRDFVAQYRKFDKHDWVQIIPMVGNLPSIWEGEFSDIWKLGESVPDENFAVVIQPYDSSQKCVVELA